MDKPTGLLAVLRFLSAAPEPIVTETREWPSEAMVIARKQWPCALALLIETFDVNQE